MSNPLTWNDNPSAVIADGSATKTNGMPVQGVTSTGSSSGGGLVTPLSGATSHKFVTYIDGSGTQHQAQPDYSDLTNPPAAPANTPAASHEFLTSYNSATGAFTQSQPAFTDLAGTLSFSALTGSIAGSQVPSATITPAMLASVEGNGSRVQLTTATTTVAGDLVTYDGSGNTQDSGTALSSLAPNASPAFTGTATFANAIVLPDGSTATTQSPLDNSANLATTQYVDSLIYVGSQASWVEDFLTAPSNAAITTATNYPNSQNWMAAQVSGGTQSIVPQDSSWAHMGQILMSTSATSGQGVVLYFAKGIGGLGSNAPWRFDATFQMVANTNICIRVGFCTSGQQTADPPTDGIWYRFNTASSDTNFVLESRSASTSSTSTANSSVADTSFHHIEINSLTPGSITFRVDGHNFAETPITTNVPTTSLVPFIQLIARSAASAQLVVDRTSFVAVTGRA